MALDGAPCAVMQVSRFYTYFSIVKSLFRFGRRFSLIAGFLIDISLQLNSVYDGGYPKMDHTDTSLYLSYGKLGGHGTIVYLKVSILTFSYMLKNSRLVGGTRTLFLGHKGSFITLYASTNFSIDKLL